MHPREAPSAETIVSNQAGTAVDCELPLHVCEPNQSLTFSLSRLGDTAVFQHHLKGSCRRPQDCSRLPHRRSWSCSPERPLSNLRHTFSFGRQLLTQEISCHMNGITLPPCRPMLIIVLLACHLRSSLSKTRFIEEISGHSFSSARSHMFSYWMS